MTPAPGSCPVRSLVGFVIAIGLFTPSRDAQSAFTEEAVARGIPYVVTQGGTDMGFGCGVAFADLDSDDDPDLVVIGTFSGAVGLYENDGTGNFVDRSAGSGLPSISAASGVTAADYDGDGDLDLYFSNWLVPNVLARNDGGFTFVDVAPAAGVDDSGAGAGCVWGDIDGNGRLDLYLANRTGSMGSVVPNRLYLARADGSFQEVAGELGVDGDDAYSFQGVFFDFDLDADLDLYLSNDKGYGGPWSNRLWRNDRGLLPEVTTTSGTGVSMNSMGVAVGDFDRDGTFDLYATNTPQGNVLYLNEGDGSFQDSSVVSGTENFHLGWGCLFLDYDNDGWVELYSVNQDAANRLYDHDGTWPCSDDAVALGLDDSGQSFGTATADVDGDGDLDLVLQSYFGPIRLYINHEGQTRSWARFRVAGRGRARTAVGARVEVTTGSVTQTAQVFAGIGYKSHSEEVAHFGLGSATSLDEVRVVWPGGKRRTLYDYPAEELWVLHRPESLGDADGNGRVDDFDVAWFWSVFTGPGVGLVQPGGEVMDLDGDSDVDLDDGALLEVRARRQVLGPWGF